MKKNFYCYMGQDKKEYFTLPTKWVPLHFVEAEEGTPVPSIEEMTLEALSSPVGTPPLQDLVSRAQTIAIIVDDGTRPTPLTKILGTLLPAMVDKGFTREDITIVVACGTHEAMKMEALEARLGGGVVSNYKVVQHNARQKDLVPVTIPGSQKVVRINPEVAHAGLKVGIGSTLPHPIAGYGGGPKILMPGVSDFDFIRDHHTKYVMHPRSKAGVTEGNPFYEGIVKTAQAIGLDFSINCVYDQQGRVIRIIGGSMEAAFAKAVEVCFEKLGHRFEEKVDVTITSTYPHTHGPQIFKGLSAPDVVTKDTGAILLVAPVAAPMSADFLNCFRQIKEKSHDNPAAYIKDHLAKGMAFLPDKSIDFNMAMTCVFLRPPIRTILVSPMISRDEARIMGLECASPIE